MVWHNGLTSKENTTSFEKRGSGLETHVYEDTDESPADEQIEEDIEMKNNMVKLSLEQTALVNGGSSWETNDDLRSFRGRYGPEVYNGNDENEKEACLIHFFYPYGVYIETNLSNIPNNYYLMDPKRGPFGELTPITRDQAWARVHNEEKMFNM